MASIDLDKMLAKVKSTQWSLSDIDWDAPGAELVTGNPELYAKLKPFMVDLMWIEHVGARGFAAMAKKAPNETLKQMYIYFHAEEQRHANAEMALMKRWGMLPVDGSMPQPSKNLLLALVALDNCADKVSLFAMAAVIPMLEITLDGALCTFLLDSVEDPICHRTFDLINDDESRHLGVGFSVMEMQGHNKSTIELIKMLGGVLNRRSLIAFTTYFPLLNKMRDNVVKMGLAEEKLYNAMMKFKKIGGRTPEGRRNPWYQIMSWHGRIVMDRNNTFYHRPVDMLVKATDFIPQAMMPKAPSWVYELTCEPVAIH
jgi:hypothetical protein